MFFVLHANVCGTSVPHHGHSHGGGHGHSHENNHGHSHEESHDNTDSIINAEPIVADIVTGQDREQILKAKKSTKNINVRAAIIHVIGDFVQSVGVLCASILIYFKVYLKNH
jgi:zinc transporter 2